MRHINLYNNFILNESYPGSETIETDYSGDNPYDVIDKYAPWYLESICNKTSDNYRVLYRGLGTDANFIISDPSGNNRKPVGLMDDTLPLYYDNIMNESESWLNFSNGNLRKNSQFVVNSYEVANSFGGVYRVIPLVEGEEFIKSVDKDTFTSFKYLENRFGISFENFMYRMRHYLDLNLSYNTIDDLRKSLDDVSNINIDKFIRAINMISKKERLDQSQIEDRGGLFKWLEHLLDPILNEFTKVKYDDKVDLGYDFDKSNGKFELWSSCKCLLVKESLIRKSKYYY